MRNLLLLLFLFPTIALSAESSPQPPQLLGVWYGTYSEPVSPDPMPAEMWMEISWQLSKDGWDIAGYNRWNILEHPDDTVHGEDSLGLLAEHFDTFKGSISVDLKSVLIRESARGNRIEAELIAADTLAAHFYAEGEGTPLFSVELNRIDTDYSPSDLTVLGLDLSHHSGQVDWKKVKAQNYRFAYVKATEGVDNPDALFEQHWRGLCEAGLARGAYHFYVTEDDPAEQARFFASRIKDNPGTLPPAVDVELLGAHTKGDLNAELLVFLHTLEGELGIKPIIYSSSRFWDAHYEPVFSDYPLWMSEYGVKMPKVPFGWDNWLIWQHAADRTIDGVEKEVDINLLHPGVQLESLMPTSASTSCSGESDKNGNGAH